MNDIHQLIKQEGTQYGNVFPKAYVQGITDKNSGKTLDEILSNFNMYFLSYDGDIKNTRFQVPLNIRKKGLWVTYINLKGNVVTEWYNNNSVEDKDWENSDNWIDGSNMLSGDLAISSEGYWVINGVNTKLPARGKEGITPLLRGFNGKLQVSYNNGESFNYLDLPTFVKEDNEDIKAVIDSNGIKELKFADKAYNPAEFSGLGRVILRKNIIQGKNVLTQEMINKPNTVYEIRYDFDLNDATINVPENCTLDFQGGSLKNGTLNNIKYIIANKDSVIFKSINVNGLMLAYTKWFDILPNLNISKADNIQRLLDMNISTVLFNDGVYYIDKPLQPKINQIINLEGTNPGLNKNTDYWYTNFDGKGVVLAPKEGVSAFIINCYCSIIGGVVDYNFKHNFEIDNGCQQTAIFIDYANANIRGTHISCAIHDYYKESVNKNHNSIGIRIGSSNNNVKGSAFNIYIDSDIKHFGIGYQIDEWVTNDLDVNLWCTSTYYNGCIWNCKRALDIKGGQGSFFKGMIQSGLTDFSDNVFVNIATTQCIFDMYIWDFNQSHGNNRYIYINKNLNHIANHIINEYKFKIKWTDNTILGGDNNYLYNKYFKNICGKGELSNYTYIESNIDNILLGADKIHKVEFFKDGVKQQTKSELFSLFDYKYESWERGEWKIKIIFSNLVNLPFIAVNCNSHTINSMKLIQYYNNNQVKTSEEIMMEKIGNNINNTGFNGYYYSRELDNSRNIYYNDIKDLSNNLPHTEAIEFVFNLTEENNIDVISLFIAKDLKNKNSNYFVSPFKDNVLYSNYSFEQNWNNKENYDNRDINSIRIPTIKWVPQPINENNGILMCRYEENNGSFLESILYNKNNELIHQRFISYTPTYRYGDNHFQNLAKKSLTINDIGYSFFNTTLNKQFIWNGTDFINNDGTNINTLKKGTTAQRPTGVQIGFTYKDTDLNKWIIWNGEAWENIDGTALV